VLCVSCFIMHHVMTNSPIILSSSFFRGSNFYTIFFYYARIFTTSLYTCLFARIVVIHSTSGRLLMLSLVFGAYSYMLLILLSISFNYGFIVSCVQIHILSLHNLVHSWSRLLMFSTNVDAILSLFSFSSGSVLGMVYDFKS
jgi:hypothetical protein